MANFYVSSAAYAAITPWAATTAYTVGQIIRPTAAVAGKRIAYRCTTGGTTAGSEPAWGLVLGGTTTSNTAVFTAINSDAYGWTGAAGDVSTVTNVSTTSFATAGSTIFLSSDHSEATAATVNWLSSIGGSWSTVTTFVLSVNRAGSVPPVAADLTSGASISFQNMYLDCAKPVYIEGLTLIASSANIVFSINNYNSYYLKNCTLQIAAATSSNKITASSYAEIILDNTSISFAHANQTITLNYSSDFTWINTASPLAGVAPTNIFFPANAIDIITCRGVDFSAYSGILVYIGANTNNIKALFDSCKISASVTALSGTPYSNAALVELVNCDDGTNVRNERYTTGGSTVTERMITLTGGAADDIGAFSLKMVSGSARIDKWVAPLDSFWIDVENLATGVAKTATVEIVSSAALYDDEIWLLLEYMGAAGTPLSTIVTSLPATILTAHAAVPTSTAAWNSAPATPAYQHLQISFTPQRAGRVRGRVMLGKASATVYVDPTIVIT